jgi:hypothetical protein
MKEDYLFDKVLRRDYEFRLWDVLCLHCRMCLGGSHDWKKIHHESNCKLAKKDG